MSKGGLGFRVEGLRVWGLGFRSSLGFRSRVWGLGFRVWGGLGFRVDVGEGFFFGFEAACSYIKFRAWKRTCHVDNIGAESEALLGSGLLSLCSAPHNVSHRFVVPGLDFGNCM